jgi:hypothetical protein
VTQFVYLESIIGDTGGTEADIPTRKRKAQAAFSMLSKIWKSAAYSMQTKLRIFNTNAKAVLLYGCETWKNSRIITAKLQVLGIIIFLQTRRYSSIYNLKNRYNLFVSHTIR